MNSQNNLVEPTNKGHRISVLALAILLTAGAVGGGVYYVLNQQIKKQDKLIEELQKKKTASNAATEKEEEKKTTTPAAKDETADWKTYTNESFGLSFMYPSSYTITQKGDLNAGEENAGSITLTDSTRKGSPTMNLSFNAIGIGGCMVDSNDISFRTKILNGKLVVMGREIAPDSSCVFEEKVIVFFDIGRANISNGFKNGIFSTFFYAGNTDYENELKKIIETIKITKENIYGQEE